MYTVHCTVHYCKLSMDFKQIEEEERTIEQTQTVFLKLAKEICVMKKKTNDLDIANVASERELKDVMKAVVEKQVELDVLKEQVAFLEETCKLKKEEEKKVVEATQEGKRRLWDKYKRFVKFADEEEARMRRNKQSSSREQRQENTRDLVAEIEVMKEFLEFQERKKGQLTDIIAKSEVPVEIHNIT